MKTFEPGTIVYHLATEKRCVVISTNEDGTVNVETQDDAKRTYSPVALITEEEKDRKEEMENELIRQRMPKNDFDEY